MQLFKVVVFIPNFQMKHMRTKQQKIDKISLMEVPKESVINIYLLFFLIMACRQSQSKAAELWNSLNTVLQYLHINLLFQPTNRTLIDQQVLQYSPMAYVPCLQSLCIPSKPSSKWY